jgi:hypothetical protein
MISADLSAILHPIGPVNGPSSQDHAAVGRRSPPRNLNELTLAARVSLLIGNTRLAVMAFIFLRMDYQLGFVLSRPRGNT